MTKELGSVNWHEKYENEKDYHKEYRQTHKEERRVTNNKVRHNNRLQLIYSLGGKCVWCGSLEELQLDHINGGGRVDYKEKNGSWQLIYYYLRNFGEACKKLQILCRRCNMKKSILYGENKRRYNYE